MSRRLSLFVAALVVVSLFAAPVAAVDSSSEDMPEEAEVGTDVEATIEVTDLYDEFEEWTLRGQTNLTDVTWTVRKYDQAGNQIDQTSYDGQEFSEDVSIGDDVNRIEVRVTGTTPEIQNLRYDPPEEFLFANLTQDRPGGTERAIDSYQVHHYTQESKETRAAIDSASEAVESSSSDEAESTLQSAISAYEAGNFENARSLAERAEDEATQSQQLQSAALYGGAAIVVLLLLGGGYYVYRSRQQGPSRLK